MNLDSWIVLHLNALAHQSQVFDRMVVLFSDETLLKGGVMFAFFWSAWFEKPTDQQERRSILTSGFVGAVASLVIARAIAVLGPYRERPSHVLAQFRLPYGFDDESLLHWSSFPSDHAALFVGIAVAILLASRRIGFVALLYSVIFICLPRIYVGYHYPSDILVGGLIGAASVLLVRLVLSQTAVLHFLREEERHPALFYMISFFVTAQLVEMFLKVRKLGVVVVHAVRGSHT